MKNGFRKMFIVYAALGFAGVAHAQSSQVIISKPASGDSYPIGSTIKIKWDGGDPSAKINLMMVDVASWTGSRFAYAIPNIGTPPYMWKLPTSYQCGRQYQIAVESMQNISLAYSGKFTIQCPQPFNP